MKSFVLFIGIASICLAGLRPATAQEREDSLKLYKEGSFVFSRIAGSPCFFIDARVGWRYEDGIDIGARMLTQISEFTASRMDDDGLQMSLLGIHAGIFRRVRSRLGAGIRLDAGFGFTGSAGGGSLPGNPDLIGYLEPAAFLSLDIVPGLYAGLGAGYRQVYGVNRRLLDNMDFNGFTFIVLREQTGHSR